MTPPIAAFFLSQGSEQDQDFFEFFAQIEKTRLQIETPGFDLGKVQNVVDQHQQGVCAAANHVNMRTLLGL
jgi:hypothetical protein